MQTPFMQRENNFDFIRLALSTLVVFSHSYPLGLGSELGEPFNVVTRHQVTGGVIAVDCFFVISGFLIASSFERCSSVASYLKKRVCRIYPGFAVVIFLSLLILPITGAHLQGASWQARSGNVILQTARLQEFRHTGAFPTNPYPNAINGSLWSIQYEFWCYIGAAALGIAGLLRSKRALLLLFFGALAVSFLFAVFRWTPGGKFLGVVFGYPPFWARLLPMYLAGIVLYRFRGHLTLKKSRIASACGLLVAAALIPYGWTVLFPIAGAYLLLVAAFHPSIRLHGWSRFGDFSYGIYLYAFPVQQLIMHWIGHAVSPWKLFSLAMPMTLACAVLSWHLVEKRFLRSARVPPKLVLEGTLTNIQTPIVDQEAA